MRNVFKIATIILCVIALGSLESFGVEFRLKDGDSITGEFVSYDGTTFRIKSKFGVLSIDASDLAVIGLNSEEGVVDIVLGAPTADDRDRIKGTIESVQENEVRIKTEYGYVVVNPLEQATGIFLSEAEVKKALTGPPTKPTTVSQAIETKGITFELQQCRLSGESLTCHFLITSQDQDKEVGISMYREYSSRLFDDAGNEYFPTKVQIGGYYEESRTRMHHLSNELVAGVPTKAEIHFEGISSQANMASLLELQCYSGDRFKIQFRNIAFSK